MSRLTLRALAGGGDLALLALRLLTGAFLIHGVWDNIESSAQMAEFAAFLGANGFPAPTLMAPLSVWAQFVCGLLFIAGALTRWAGLIMAFNFVVAVLMVHWGQSFREVWPAAILIAVPLILATIGAGRFSIDQVLEKGA